MKRVSKVIWWGVLAVLVLAAFVALWGWGGKHGDTETQRETGASPQGAGELSASVPLCLEEEQGEEAEEEDEDADEEESEEDTDEDEEEELTEEEKREREEEKLVDAFDDLTDTWDEPSKKEITMADIDAFGAAFRKVPDDRKDECVHRALNLIPDENVMLLAGILMDKSNDKEIIEEVFNDVLNRDEDVKEPILRQIFKDKEHPCWDDVAWIFDVTDDLPQEGE